MRRKEPKRSLLVVYLIENKETGKAVYASLTRQEAREIRHPNERVVRCEFLRTRRKGGGA